MAEAKMPDGTVVIIPDPNGMTCCNEVRGPYKPQPSRAEVWAMFAAAVLPKMPVSNQLATLLGGNQ